MLLFFNIFDVNEHVSVVESKFTKYSLFSQKNGINEFKDSQKLTFEFNASKSLKHCDWNLQKRAEKKRGPKL